VIKIFVKKTVILSLIIILSSFAAYGENISKMPRGINKHPVQVNENDTNTKIMLCRQLIRQRRFIDAAALLETIYEQNPDNVVVINLLRKCYENLQLNEKAEQLISRYLKKHPDNFGYWLLYAETLADQAKFEQAGKAYDKAGALIDNNNIVRWQLIVQSMVTHNMDDKALSLIDNLRKKTADKILFALQRGSIFQKQKKYTDATLEFYSLLPDTTRLGNEAEKKLLAMLSFDDSAKEVEKTLLNQKHLLKNKRAVKILSTYYLQTAQYKKAFEFTIARDSLDGFKGNSLVAYMNNCAERKLYPQALSMGDYISRHYQNNPIMSEAHFIYAQVLQQMGRYVEAVAVYDTIFAGSIYQRDKATALYQIGKIYRDDLNQYDRALVYFDSIRYNFSNGLSYTNILKDIAYCYLKKGDLKKAQTQFQQLLNTHINDNIKEEVTYNIGLIFFLEKNIDSSKAVFNKLLVDFPRGFYVNDALSLMFIMDEAQGFSQILYDYSNTLLFEQRNMIDSAIAKLKLIANDKSQVLADIALFKLSKISLKQADTTQTLEYVDQLTTTFPQSYYLPYGLKEKADILLSTQKQDEIAKAKNIYKELLGKYPNYPFITEVRKKLRELEANQGSA